MKYTQDFCHLKQSGNCNVCGEVLENARKAHNAIDKSKVVQRVELDMKKMIDIHNKLSNGNNID